jgi:protein-tyrosine kinase
MKFDNPAIADLVTRVEAHLPGEHGRVVGFVASGAGEGSSSVARAYASNAQSRLGRNVLLLETSAGSGKGRGVLQALAENLPLDELLSPLPEGGSVGSLGGDADAALWELVARPELWQALRARFECIVLDLPNAERSRLGLALAPHCDGVVIVVEADKSRQPVVLQLVDSLRGVNANVLGTVLNKRRFYLPERLYRWL